MEEWDLVIIGAGPSGLALAQCVSNLNKRILIIEKESTIGGCHRVRRVQGLFTEHGPRVYSSTYKVFNDLLKEMGVKFDDLFVKYNFQLARIGGETVFTTLSWKELWILSLEFIKLIINNNHGRDIILGNFLVENNFKNDSLEIIDRICKLTDGGGMDKYTLQQFLQLFNQQFFYSLYQPKVPNDIGLLKIWKEFLEKRGVVFYLNRQIKDIIVNKVGISDGNSIRNTKVIESLILDKNDIIKAKKIVFAIPPKNIDNVITKHKIEHNWGNISKFANDTAYIDYISVAFNWDTNLNLEKVYGFPKSSWGIAFIVLSDYMTFGELDSKTVISTAVTLIDKKSKRINKTANECNANELVNEIFIQLKESFPNLPNPKKVIISPGVKRNNNKWETEDTAYIMTSNAGYLPFKNDIVENMYNLGTHNGKSIYKFTSLESAVSNAVILSKELYNELNDSKYIKLTGTVTFSDVTRWIIGIVLIIIFIYLTMIKWKSL